MRRDPEGDLQIAAVNLMRYVLPVDAVLHHSHNEGKRSKRDAARAKAMGQCPGFADLIVLWRSVIYFIEFKVEEDPRLNQKKTYQSKAQKEFEAAIDATGFPHYAVVRSIDELVGVLRAWGLAQRKIGNAAPIPDPFRGRQDGQA